uniref:SLC26A/SulP transporter domain-containing protein n=1 Tax=Photinus pyralis TaxID=7054 RepID=A0A1Y1MPJ6_PHOPY
MAGTKLKVYKFIRRRLPILQWAREYTLQKFVCDTIAGITVALTVMPQALAYATLGGLEPQYGLYSSFVGCFVYIFFGNCKDITIGPTALMSLMTYQQVLNRNPDYAVLLCFLSGVVQLLMAVLNLGILVDFISIPVTVGFTSATSVIIAVSQFKGLLGLSFSSSGFLDTLVKVYENIHDSRASDCILSVICVTVLIALKKMKDVKIFKGSRHEKFISRTLWLISTARNALVVITCSVIAYCYESSGTSSPFLLTGSIKPGLPSFQVPPFETTLHNKTIPFADMFTDLGSSVFLVPIIAVLGNVAIAKAFAAGQGIDATQELFTLSLANMFGSFFSSMPVTGSFSRSAVNHASGVQTQLGGLYTGILVILALSFLTPYFAFIPKSSLAAVIICAVIFMIEYEIVKPMWRSNKKDIIPTFATFILCLIVGVEYGILLGVGINMIFILYPSARPSITLRNVITTDGLEYILITPGSSLYFPGIEFIKSNIGKAGLKSLHLPVVVDCRHILGADFTAAKGIAALMKEFFSRKQSLYFLNLHDDVIGVLKGAAVDDFRHFNSTEELENSLKSHRFENNETSHLLLDVETHKDRDLDLHSVGNGTAVLNHRRIN